MGSSEVQAIPGHTEAIFSDKEQKIRCFIEGAADFLLCHRVEQRQQFREDSG